MVDRAGGEIIKKGLDGTMEMMKPTWSTPLPMMPGKSSKPKNKGWPVSQVAIWVLCPGYHGNQESRKGKQGNTISDRDRSQRVLMWRFRLISLFLGLKSRKGLKLIFSSPVPSP